MSHKRAICPGSFDPFTLGHRDIIERASTLFDEVIVAIAEDAQKHHVFTVDERVEMAAAACADIAGVSVEAFDGLLVEYCRSRDAVAIVKGLRGSEDLPHEQQMAQINSRLAPEIQTVFLLASPQYSHIRSSMIRWAAQLGADMSSYLPPNVAERLQQKYSGGHQNSAD